MITRYHREIQAQTGFRPTSRYSTKSARNLDAVKKYVGQEPGFPRLRVAYIPIPNGTGKPKVTIKRGKVTVTTNRGQSGEVNRTGYLFDDFGDVSEDSDAVAKRIIKDDAGTSQSFKMMCGQNESIASFSKEFLAERIRHYLDAYDNTEKWFHGVVGYRFEGQATFREYQKLRKEFTRKTKKRKKS